MGASIKLFVCVFGLDRDLPGPLHCPVKFNGVPSWNFPVFINNCASILSLAKHCGLPNDKQKPGEAETQLPGDPSPAGRPLGTMNMAEMKFSVFLIFLAFLSQFCCSTAFSVFHKPPLAISRCNYLRTTSPQALLKFASGQLICLEPQNLPATKHAKCFRGL
jgi:hypothetical protein